MGKAARRAGWGVVERLPKTAPKAPFSATQPQVITETYAVNSRKSCDWKTPEFTQDQRLLVEHKKERL